MKVTLSQIALRKGISYRAVKKRRDKGLWQPCGSAIVKHKETEIFEAAGLPEDLKALFEPVCEDTDRSQSEAPDLPAESPGPEESLPQMISDQQQGLTSEARKKALARLDLVRGWERYREEHQGGLAADIDREFVTGYNTGAVFQNIHNILGDVSLPTLYRYKAQLNGTRDWKLLAPRYGKTAQAQRLNAIEENIFQAFILSPNKIKVGTAVRLTRFALERKGYTSDKCDMTYRRYAEDFKARYYDKWVLLREGQKALRDKVEPYIKRDPSVLEVGDALVADGHRLNFQVINPFTGKPCRATLLAYVDWKSYDLAGYEIMLQENTQCIASAMRNAILRLGKLPRVSYQDNGKAFRGKFFTGADLEESGFHGLFGRLGIVPVFARPYNARAKIVERWFKEFSDTFERLFPSFIGASIADKPAYLMRNEKMHKALHNEYIPTIEEATALLECWLEFHRSQECEHVKGKSVGEVFNEGRGPGVNIAELDDLMMDFRITRIDRNGVRFLGQDYYEEALTGVKENVLIRYSLFDLSYIKVYALNGEFICRADRVASVHPLANVLGTPKDMEEVSRRIADQKRLEKKIIQGSKELLRLGHTPQVEWQKVIELAPRIADRLEAENIQTPEIEEHIPEEAVRTEAPKREITHLEPQTRPFFENNISRYEWHLKYGVLTEEDEAWCIWFRTTGEFRMLFTEMQKEKALLGGPILNCKESITG